MKSLVFLIAGALFVSTAFGSDPYAEERFKAKYGRYTPAEETRREAAKKAQATTAKSDHPQAQMCEIPNCCKRETKAATAKVSTADTHAEALFRAKYGRPSPMKEARIAEAKRQAATSLASNASVCDGDCCHRTE